jgi:hypothetical protein
MSETDKEEQQEGETTGFKISDRRKFTAEGEPITTSDESGDPGTAAEPEEKTGGRDSAESRPSEKEARDESKAQQEPEELDFSSFILSLATSVLTHLGEVPDPSTGEKKETLEAARQMIDILSLLEVKTKGNLDPSEERLLQNLLYELRMKYLSKAKIISL